MAAASPGPRTFRQRGLQSLSARTLDRAPVLFHLLGLLPSSVSKLEGQMNNFDQGHLYQDRMTSLTISEISVVLNAF